MFKWNKENMGKCKEERTSVFFSYGMYMDTVDFSDGRQYQRCYGPLLSALVAPPF